MDQVNRETTFRFYLKRNFIDLRDPRELNSSIYAVPSEMTFSVYLDTGDDHDRPFFKIATREHGSFKSLNYAKIEGHIDNDWYYREKIEIKTEAISLETISEEEIHKWFGELIVEQGKRGSGSI